LTHELRALPPETVEGLLHPPGADFPYFAGADRFPFEPHTPGYSAVNAWWLADACFLVYGDSRFIEDTLKSTPLPGQGFRMAWLGSSGDNRGMILENDDALIVVFRGTRLQVHSLLEKAEILVMNQDDLWVDGQFLPAVHQAGGRVHSGFLKAFGEVSELLDGLVSAKKPSQTVWLTGHSLGGALATLAAAHLGRDAVNGLYTYGSPRVGDAAFVKVLPERGYYRFVHRDDWVTTVPPKILGYVHAGVEILVPGSPPRNRWTDLTTGATEFAKVLTTLARELQLRNSELPFKLGSIADHAPIYYATLLWNGLVHPVQSDP